MKQSAQCEATYGLMLELMRTTQAVVDFLARILKTHGITSVEYDVLESLFTVEGQTLSEISGCTYISNNTLTGVIDRLVGKNYIERYGCSHDRRCVRVKLTEYGRRQVESIRGELLTALDKQIGETVSCSDAGAFMKFLGAVRAGI